MKHSAKNRKRDQIDETLDQSFPASDPPAWNLGREPRPERSGNGSKRRRAAPARRSRTASKTAPRPTLRISPLPRGLRLLSPRAWLRWALHPVVQERR
jgi:hypothetical protein